MAKLGNAVVFFSGDLRGLNDALGQAQARTKATVGNITAGMSKVGAGMTAVGTAALAGFGYAVKGAADFDKSMREVNTLLNLGKPEFEGLKEQVSQLSQELGIAAPEAAKALYQAISAGVPKENAIEFLRVAGKGAVGGVTDVETAVNGLTTVLNAFGKPVTDSKRVMDVMFTTMKGGKTTIGELSQYMFQAAPKASALGVSFDELSATMVALTLQGTPTSVAFTQTRAAMDGITRPGEKLAKIFKAAGYESGEAAVKQIGLQKSLGILTGATGGSVSKMQELLGSSEAAAAALGITGKQAHFFAGASKNIANSAGAADQAFKVMSEGVSFEAAQAQQDMEAMRREIGEGALPVFRDLLKETKPLVQEFTAWIRTHPQAIRGLVVMAGALAVGGPLLMGLSSMATIFTTMTTALPLAAKGIASMIGSAAAIGGGGLLGLGVAIGGIVGAAGIGWAIGTWIDKAINNWFPSFAKAIDWVFDKINGLIEKIKEWLGLQDKATRDERDIDELMKAGMSREAAELLIKGREHRASGGPVFAGRGYIVGEHGPEFFNPSQSGTIINNNDLRKMADGGGGGQTINVTINGARMSAREIVAEMRMQMRLGHA